MSLYYLFVLFVQTMVVTTVNLRCILSSLRILKLPVLFYRSFCKNILRPFSSYIIILKLIYLRKYQPLNLILKNVDV